MNSLKPSSDNKLTFMERLAHSEVPRRVLGAVIAAPVPGAGHVILGYPRVGWIIAAATLSLIAVAALGAVAGMPGVFLVAAAMMLLLTVGSIVSIFVLPPGPHLKNGLRALWPVLALFVIVRGFVFLMGAFVLQVAPVPDDAMAPALRQHDTLLVHPGAGVVVGDVAYVEHPAGKFVVRRVAGIDADKLELSSDTDPSLLSIERSEVRGKALFVLGAGKVDGRGRIWKPLSKR
ncbi:MAG: S24/S26 family peptidase [Polyangia bacterium]